jgi:hypothetical protein
VSSLDLAVKYRSEFDVRKRLDVRLGFRKENLVQQCSLGITAKIAPYLHHTKTDRDDVTTLPSLLQFRDTVAWLREMMGAKTREKRGALAK